MAHAPLSDDERRRVREAATAAENMTPPAVKF